MFKVDTKITKELVEEWDDAPDLFYRFQKEDYAIEGEYEQSWGQIFTSAAEARESAEEWGLSEDEAVLPGKSCMNTFRNIISFSDRFDEKYVLLVFEGRDTYVNGHDDEFVAEYIAPIAIISFDDAIEYYNENY